MTKDYILKAIDAEIPYEEMRNLAKDKYLHSTLKKIYGRKGRFMPERFIDVCMKRLNGKINNEYFIEWVDFIDTFLDTDFFHISYLFADILYSDYKYISDLNVKKMIHIIKDFEIKNKYKCFIKEQQDKKMKVIYLRKYESFGAECYDDFYYIAYYVDHDAREYDIRFITEKELDYPLDKNIVFLEEDSSDRDYEPLTIEDEDDLHGFIDLYKRNKNIVI